MSLFRFIIYNPASDSYIKFTDGCWTSGHDAEEVNSYDSLNEAREAIKLFESLQHCQIVEVHKTIDIIKTWH